jgi:PPM family protein phosphatase
MSRCVTRCSVITLHLGNHDAQRELAATFATVNSSSLPPAPFFTASLLLGSRGAGEDRLAVLPCASGLVLVVADGAGGMGGGAEAAAALVAAVHTSAEALATGALDPSSLLRSHDRRAQPTGGAGGQCTVVIAIVRDADVSGASVGDSGALRSRKPLRSGSDAVEDLTAGQQRKPLIGSGAAVPVSFRGPPLDGTLLLATDGLLKYASWRRLTEALDHAVLDELPALLLSLVRLPTGALQDDVGLIVCRR